MGVWIETRSRKPETSTIASHTLRGCVDWNLPMQQKSTPFIMSHPSWVCGLKLPFRLPCYTYKCHTLRGCVDWNYILLACRAIYAVTPFVGVWIETLACKLADNRGWSHTLRGCVDWNLSRSQYLACNACHTLRGCVDINEWIKCRRIWMKKWFVGISDRPLNVLL